MALDIEELDRLEKAATLGPWQATQRPQGPDPYWWTIADLLSDGGNKLSWMIEGTAENVDAYGTVESNARLIAALRNAAPALIAAAHENARLRDVLTRIIAISADRERFVRLGPRGWLAAETIAIEALATETKP